jgi:hypothetical protein
MTVVFPLEPISRPPKTGSSGIPIKPAIVVAMAKQYEAAVKASDVADGLVRVAQQLTESEPPPAPVCARALRRLHGQPSIPDASDLKAERKR